MNLSEVLGEETISIEKDTFRKELLKVFYKSSVDEIMEILEQAEATTIDLDFHAKKNNFGLDFTESKKKHSWKLSQPHPTRRRRVYGGSSSYKCKDCGQTMTTSWACLPERGCNG